MLIRMPSVEVPTPDTSKYTDPANWPPQVWAVIAGVLIIAFGLFLWRNMNDKIKLALVLILGFIAAVYFMA